MTATTKVFRSGNSVALRLPKVLGIKEGTKMTVREEQGRYIVEPVEAEPKKIDLSGIWGSCPSALPIERDEHDYDDVRREWHLLGLDDR